MSHQLWGDAAEHQKWEGYEQSLRELRSQVRELQIAREAQAKYLREAQEKLAAMEELIGGVCPICHMFHDWEEDE